MPNTSKRGQKQNEIQLATNISRWKNAKHLRTSERSPSPPNNRKKLTENTTSSKLAKAKQRISDDKAARQHLSHKQEMCGKRQRRERKANERKEKRAGNSKTDDSEPELEPGALEKLISTTQHSLRRETAQNTTHKHHQQQKNAPRGKNWANQLHLLKEKAKDKPTTRTTKPSHRRKKKEAEEKRKASNLRTEQNLAQPSQNESNPNDNNCPSRRASMPVITNLLY
ncbi:hypothetical protein GALMADRAFT_215180 [Galerina marginata CBS 339.88]|uniref:Uncharacterized protein n=1 Tax=Galerina marginata (strain CBS 339.88) TaxID=685588 RepID=A0A067SF25_GALM3|nr:hypothetical protein GALMADRAFT_215180 [Galerina marginata CBS 339.88]